MNKLLLNAQNAENEDSVIINTRPEFNRICYNPIRASIIYMLARAKELNYCLSVEEIAQRLGKRHSVVIHHLEKLESWKIVNVVKLSRYGEKQKRSIWGLNLKYPNLIENIFSYMTKTFFSVNDLERMSRVNINVRGS